MGQCRGTRMPRKPQQHGGDQDKPPEIGRPILSVWVDLVFKVKEVVSRTRQSRKRGRRTPYLDSHWFGSRTVVQSWRTGGAHPGVGPEALRDSGRAYLTFSEHSYRVAFSITAHAQRDASTTWCWWVLNGLGGWRDHCTRTCCHVFARIL